MIAIVKMQALFRGKRARKLVALIRERFHILCALRIQTAWRGAR